MNFAREAVRRKPLRHGIGVEESAINALGRGAQNAVESDGVGIGCGHRFSSDSIFIFITNEVTCGGQDSFLFFGVGSDSLYAKRSMHFYFTGSNAFAVVIELNIGMLREEGHGDGGV